MGADSKYKGKYCDDVILHMKDGLSFDSFAGKIGVSKKTLYNWCEMDPDFEEAKEIGQMMGLLYWETFGKDHVLNVSEKNGDSSFSKSINATVWLSIMKNRFGWREKQADEAPDTVVNNTINFTQDQIREMIKTARNHK